MQRWMLPLTAALVAGVTLTWCAQPETPCETVRTAERDCQKEFCQKRLAEDEVERDDLPGFCDCALDPESDECLDHALDPGGECGGGFDAGDIMREDWECDADSGNLTPPEGEAGNTGRDDGDDDDDNAASCDQFECADGTCIKNKQRCDGEPDCPLLGEDELACDAENPLPPMAGMPTGGAQ